MVQPCVDYLHEGQEFERCGQNLAAVRFPPQVLQVVKKFRTIPLTGPLTCQYVLEFRSALATLVAASTAKPIYLIIDSGGGCIEHGLQMIDLMNLCPAPIIGIVIGRCCSMAIPVLFACQAKRYGLSSSTYLIHHGHSWHYNTLSPRRPRRQVYTREFSFELAKRVDSLLKQKLGINQKALEKLHDKGDDGKRYFADEAKNIGFIDEIVSDQTQVKNILRAARFL